MRCFALMVLTCALSQPSRGAEISPEQVEQDIAWLDGAIQERYAYFPLKASEHEKIFAGIRQEAKTAKTAEKFGRVLVHWLARYGDGHLTLKNRARYLEPGRVPCVFAPVGLNRVVALREDRSDFLDAEHPFVQSIDGLPITDCLSEARKRVCDGHESYVFRRAVQRLQYVNEVRSYVEKPVSTSATLELSSADGKSSAVHVLNLVDNGPSYQPWPVRESSMLEGQIGYLRINEMDDSPEFAKSLIAAMEKFRSSNGLVIDVRGNSGGDRKPLLTLFPYFVAPEDKPVPVYVAAQSYPRDWGANQPAMTLKKWRAFPSGYTGWNGLEQSAIDSLHFSPEWKPPQDRFSPLHFTVLGSSSEPDCFYYDKKVVLLIDEYCFSATDVFAGAFALLPQVTLIGNRTGGGAGIVDSYALPNSGLEVWIPKSAGFRPDGKLYNGRGIKPDIIVEPTPRFWLENGDDPALRRALKELAAL